MELATVRYVAAGEPIEALPGQPVSLAPSEQGVPPSAANLAAETLQSPEIAWDRVVVEIPLHHSVQPRADDGDRLVPSPHQCGSNGRQRRAQALLRREANDLEPTLAVRSTAVREPEKVERLRVTLPPISTVGCGESTKLDQPGLVRVQRQSEFRKPFLQVMQKPLRRLLALESHYAVVGIANDDDITPGLLLAPVVRPQIEHVMQVDIR